MKIIGFIYRDGKSEMVLKGDSCLLNGRKPFFIPDGSKEIGVTPCLILRVSRLGKEIAYKFADRYYDAIAPGEDFVALDLLREAEKAGKPWTKALAFDYSLAIGEWMEAYPYREGRRMASNAGRGDRRGQQSDDHPSRGPDLYSGHARPQTGAERRCPPY